METDQDKASQRKRERRRGIVAFSNHSLIASSLYVIMMKSRFYSAKIIMYKERESFLLVVWRNRNGRCAQIHAAKEKKERTRGSVPSISPNLSQPSPFFFFFWCVCAVG